MHTERWKVEESLKACLFDFGGTLDADGATWQDRFYALYGKHGVCVDREAFRQAFYDADDTLTETRALEAAGLDDGWLRVAPDRRTLGIAVDTIRWQQTGP